jgi:methyl-accepting chemotaxis protein
MFNIAALTIRTRLAVGFGLLIMMMLILTIVGIRNVNHIDSTLMEITDINSVKQRYAINFRGSVHDRAIAIRDLVFSRNWEESNKFQAEIDRLAAFYEEADQGMQQMMQQRDLFSDEERRMLTDIARIESRTLPLMKRIAEAKTSNSAAQLNAIVLDEALPAFSDWLARINDFIDYQERANQTLTPVARDIASGFQTLMLVLTAVAIVIATAVALYIGNSIHCSIGGEPSDAQHSLARIAEGQLNTTVETKQSKSLLASLALMQNRLRETVNSIVDASHELHIQADTIENGSGQMEGNVSSQAQLTGATVENLRTIEESINNARTAASSNQSNASEMVEQTNQGNASVSQTAKKMEQLAGTVEKTVTQIQSLADVVKEIGGITGVINEISDQTNLLALNAAIEAARAGDSGRGFAVVAQEVRELAMRTSEATAKIDGKIQEVQQQTNTSVDAMNASLPLVQEGRDETQMAAQVLLQIRDQANQTLNNAGNVQKAAEEQVNRIQEIADAMSQIDAMSQSSLQDLQNNHIAVQELVKVSNNLKQLMAFFKT